MYNNNNYNNNNNSNNNKCLFKPFAVKNELLQAGEGGGGGDSSKFLIGVCSKSYPFSRPRNTNFKP